MSDKRAPGDYWEGTEAELKRMCSTLRECCVKYNLGLGGEFLDELMVKENERLRAELEQVRGAAK